MSTVWLFPGQDAFQPLTGCDWAAADRGVARLLERVEAEVALDLRTPRGRRRLVRFDTAVVQPLLVALCLGIAERLVEAGAVPGAVAGASLGELPAWGLAERSPPTEVVEVALARGAAMRDAAQQTPGGMVALTGNAEHVQEALAAGRSAGIADLAAHNGAEEWVLTGDRPALAAITAAFPVRPVPVSGPWHSAPMSSAADALERALRRVEVGALQTPMLLNDHGRFAEDGPDVRHHLVRQLTHPVFWYETLVALPSRGFTDVVTVGPGRVLRAQLHRTLGSAVRVHGTDDPRALAATLEQIP